jgi:CotH kinase protein
MRPTLYFLLVACGPQKSETQTTGPAEETGEPQDSRPPEDTDTGWTGPDTADTDPPEDTTPGDSGSTDSGSAEGGSIDSGPTDIGEPEDPEEALFSDEVLPVFEIDIAPIDVASLLSDPYSYVSCDLTINGTLYEDVAIRTKGENSWRPFNEKPSLKLKLDEYVPDRSIGDLQELTLNAMNDDDSMMHERVAYRLYREFGLPAARATHATVYVNGEYYGLYTHLETVDKNFIRRHFDDPDGTLFEQHDVDYTEAYVPLFTLEYGDETLSDEELRANLYEVADAMTSLDPETRVVAARDALSWDSFRRYWAVGAVVGQFDAYPYSSPGDDAHVYDDPDTEMLHYIPHGVDETFYSPDTNVITAARGLLSLSCVLVESCQEELVANIWEAQGVSEEVDLYNYALEVQAQIAPLIAADEHRDHTDEAVNYYQTVMIDMIEGRAAALESQIGARPAEE